MKPAVLEVRAVPVGQAYCPAVTFKVEGQVVQHTVGCIGYPTAAVAIAAGLSRMQGVREHLLEEHPDRSVTVLGVL